jgi:hypothetical protein
MSYLEKELDESKINLSLKIPSKKHFSNPNLSKAEIVLQWIRGLSQFYKGISLQHYLKQLN